ncbi:hypothetical protein M422DRAFT_28283 [Sphaerobolus stellatus SS14]|nr:hypothetical protein M422DRAFT_28283 [Sphaerobolus stellatus SS14]
MFDEPVLNMSSAYFYDWNFTTIPSWNYVAVSAGSSSFPPSTYDAYVKHRNLLRNLRLMSRAWRYWCTPYFLKFLWFTHPVQLEAFVRSWQGRNSHLKMVKRLRMELPPFRLENPNLDPIVRGIPRPVVNLDDWVRMSNWVGSWTDGDLYVPPTQHTNYPVVRKVRELYEYLLDSLRHLVSFDNGYTGGGVVIPFSAAAHFLHLVANNSTANHLHSLRISLPPDELYFYGAAPYLISLEELTIDYLRRDDTPWELPSEIPPLYFPRLRWLSLGGCSTIPALCVAPMWELPALEHFICRSGVQPEDALIETLSVFGKTLRRLYLSGNFSSGGAFNLQTLCPCLVTFEVDGHRAMPLLEPHTGVEMFIFHNLDYLSPSSPGLVAFDKQIDNFLNYRPKWDSLKIIVDSGWAAHVETEKLRFEARGPSPYPVPLIPCWWNPKTFMALHDKKIKVQDGFGIDLGVEE